MHRKLCVVDSRVAFCGGINILDDHHDLNHGPQDSPRFDFAVRVTGPLVLDIHAAVLQFWVRLQVTRQLERLRFRGVRAVLQGQVKLAPSQQGTAAGLVLRDNLRNRNRIERAYRKAIGEARRDVLIANAYFLPGAKIRRALISAARRGVRVRLLLQGRYEYFMQYHAARPVYGALLEAGVEIYEYQTGFLHAKVAVVDGHWATVGSSNLDPLSLQLAREANVVVDDIAFAAALGERLELAIQQHGRQLDALAYAERPWRQRVLDRLAFGLMRLMLFLTGRRY
jgi:cardiolipin synthase